MQIYNDTYCVYIHYFPNGKIYVGITGDKPHRRWKSDGSGYHTQPVIYNAIKKYGWDNIKHEIIASNLTQDEACNFERILIEALDSTNHNYGYNVDRGGLTSGRHSQETLQKISDSMKRAWRNGTYKREFTKETLQKMSDAKKGLYLGANNPAAKSVICIETGKIFPTTKSAADSVSISGGTIRSCLRGRCKTAGGYHWKCVNE